MILTINGKQAALKKGSSIEYVSENRIFTDADDYSMEIELPLADCPQNLDIFGMITRKDVDTGDIFFDAVLQDTNFFKRGAVVITGITQESVKVQFLEKRSYQHRADGFGPKPTAGDSPGEQRLEGYHRPSQRAIGRALCHRQHRDRRQGHQTGAGRVPAPHE